MCLQITALLFYFYDFLFNHKKGLASKVERTFGGMFFIFSCSAVFLLFENVTFEKQRIFTVYQKYFVAGGVAKLLYTQQNLRI